MRKFVESILLAVLLIVGMSCEKQFEEVAELQSANSVAADEATSYEVSYEEALAKADALFAEIDGATTRSGNRRVKNHELFRSGKRFTRTQSNDGIEARFHIINYENNAGFAMVAADKRATAIYAYSDTGNLDVDDAIENTGFGVFITGAVEYYNEEINTQHKGYDSLIFIGPKNPFDPYTDITSLLTEELYGKTYYVKYYDKLTTISSKSQMLKTSWHQQYPYNVFCPQSTENGVTDNCLAGCGSVALAQIMSYYRKPSSYNGYKFNWSIMTNVSGFSTQSETSDMVARLISEIGIAAGANYGLTGTSTTTRNEKFALNSFGYTTSSIEDFNREKILSSLKNDYLVYARGVDASGGGHAWVIDGYDYQIKGKTYYYDYEPYNVFQHVIDESTTLYHCNWGWGNIYNCYCCYGAFNTYNGYNKIIYNIK